MGCGNDTEESLEKLPRYPKHWQFLKPSLKCNTTERNFSATEMEVIRW
jgi:hypothetical protein